MAAWNRADTKTRILALISVLALGVSPAAAQSGPGWMRHGSISPDSKTIVFTCQRTGLARLLAIPDRFWNVTRGLR